MRARKQHRRGRLAPIVEGRCRESDFALNKTGEASRQRVMRGGFQQ